MSCPGRRSWCPVSLRPILPLCLVLGCAGAAPKPSADAEALKDLRMQMEAQSALVQQQQRRIEELEVKLAGLVRESRGDCSGALQLFESVPAKYPAGDAVPQSMLERGRCLRIMGRRPEAKAILMQLEREHPEAPETAFARQLLQDL